MTRLLTPSDLDVAVEILRQDGLVVFPTETVYGLGAHAGSRIACQRVYQAKGRPPDNPLIVHLADSEDLSAAADRVPRLADELAKAFWPGPLTMVLPKGEGITGAVTAGLDTVALRCPDHDVARELIRRCGFAIAAPSANRSGRPSPTSFEMAVAEMNGRAGAIIDGGTCRRGLESTVAMITEDSVTILRPGSITAEMLGEVIGSPVDTLLTSEDTGPRSPGTRHAHYQPRAPVFVTNVVDLPRIASAFSERPVGVLCLNCGTSSAPHGLIIRSLDDLDDYAHRLYREFTLLDEMGCCAIVAELPASGGLGDALRDRLLRASGGRTVPHGT